jgi:signal transduction histidine kinase
VLNLATTSGDASGHAERTPTTEDRLRHDLRQSLAAVIALAGVVADDPLRGSCVIDWLSHIVRETEQVSRLLERGTPEETSGYVDVGELVSQQWGVVAVVADCTVRLVRDPETRLHVDDLDMLRRAVRNLLDNAVRAAGPGGDVEVRVLARGRGVVVEVADSGPGFGRIPTHTGLGLLTVRRLASACGGSFQVGSSDLGGAEVSLHLPAYDGGRSRRSDGRSA